MDKEAYDFGLEIFLRLDLERRSVWSLQNTPTNIFLKKKTYLEDAGAIGYEVERRWESYISREMLKTDN